MGQDYSIALNCASMPGPNAVKLKPLYGASIAGGGDEYALRLKVRLSNIRATIELRQSTETSREIAVNPETKSPP